MTRALLANTSFMGPLAHADAVDAAAPSQRNPSAMTAISPAVRRA
jgi:hypothetical protein